MGFSRQEYWSGVPLPSPGDLPNPGIEPRDCLLHCRQTLYRLSHQGSTLVAHKCLTLQPHGTEAHQIPLSMGILQARRLEWVAVSYILYASLIAQLVKNVPAMQKTLV